MAPLVFVKSCHCFRCIIIRKFARNQLLQFASSFAENFWTKEEKNHVYFSFNFDYELWHYKHYLIYATMYAAEMNFCCHFQPHFAIFSHSLDVIFKASRPSFVIVFHYGWSLKTRQRLFASFKSTCWSVPPTFLDFDFFYKK